jgi:hypothetical protein
MLLKSLQRLLLRRIRRKKKRRQEEGGEEEKQERIGAPQGGVRPRRPEALALQALVVLCVPDVRYLYFVACVSPSMGFSCFHRCCMVMVLDLLLLAGACPCIA